MQLHLYYFDQCPFCQIVLRKIKDEKLESFIEYKNIMTDPENRTFHKSKTGKTTVPCLYIDGAPMFESHDIANWLEQNAKAIKE